MLRLHSKSAWFGGAAALVSVLAMVACSDDEGGGGGPTAGTGNAGEGPEAGAPNGSGGSSAGSAGSASAGSATAGTASEGGMAGDGSGTGGDGGEPGVAGQGGEGGALPSELDQLRALFEGTSPLPAVPADPTNLYADNAAAATLGQRFFFDEKFSGALAVDSDLGTAGDLQKVSCASCHSGPAMADERSAGPVSIGVGVHSRNAPGVVNSAFYTWTNWGGRFSAQWELPLVVVESPVIMAGNRLAIAHRIYDVYKSDYEAVFGVMPASIAGYPAAGKLGDAAGYDGLDAADKTIVDRVLVNFSKALQAYMRKLVSRNAPFDSFMAGDDDAISASAIAGARLFAGKAGCIACHNGPTFSDQGFHDLGVLPDTDNGRFKDTPGLLASPYNRNGVFSDKTDTGKLEQIPTPQPDSWKGAFRTPSLRGVSLTGPYMHAGQLATLWDVMEFYSKGGSAATAENQLSALNLTGEEKGQLIDFLATLTGEAVPSALVQDTAAP